ncbi:hypothetical protein PS928_05012 [Pseudomonas fluorescens]|uniref:Uncharacterized protein n=1 Tax=Pseudomonas fluorescens TaxID=294 RepID=A0A5E7VD72_PSEFL|nr:hypothetical protein PS928_05012 [Pseudomonas fluorescens]
MVKLKALFKQYRKTETMLMAPFEMLDKNALAEIKKWRMELKGFVSFAVPSIRVS